MITIQEFIKKMKTNSVVRENVPMGLGMGFPMISITKESLLVSVFYYRSVVRPEDASLLMPPECILTFEYPSGKLVSFENLRLDSRFAKVVFEKPVGYFRHDAIKHLNRAEYKEERENLYNALNRLIAALGGLGEFSQEDEAELKRLYSMMIEPGLYPFYKFLSPQFFERYVK